MRRYASVLALSLTLLSASSASLAVDSGGERTMADRAAAGYTVEEDRAPGWALDQARRLSASAEALAPQRPGVVDAYVLVAGLDRVGVFQREVAEAAKLLSARFDAKGRMMVLSTGSETSANGSPPQFAAALAALAAKMDVKEDVLILYSTSHGAKSIGIVYMDGDHGFGVIGPTRLKSWLDDLHVKNRLVMISACYSGQFVPTLRDANSVILTAASRSMPSFGCAPGNDWTFFGDALINNALRKPQGVRDAATEAFDLIKGWEKSHGLARSNPQSHFGKDSKDWLAALDKAMPKEASKPVGTPAAAILDAGMTPD